MIIVLFGRNGVGKIMILCLVMGFYCIVDGEIYYDSVKVSGLFIYLILRKGIGYVLEN